MTAKTTAAIFICVSPFWSADGVARDGDRVSENSPLYKNNQRHFIPDGATTAEVADARTRAMFPELAPPPPPPSPFLPPEKTRRCIRSCQMVASNAAGLWVANVGDILAADNLLVKKQPQNFEKVTP